ncbi:MAG: addiction module toxin, HicA family [Chloroflexi bacterium]|nr:type II toxin-antitoxin system HicA family toxin [Dehalococcoidia bacterium]PKB76280.1 MAG: addiction module toxin, HicA family [SAR202 cluster bacterium MP-SAtl-SRR3965592-G1]PKB81626.1 MAG: addiction module toxin, HicA family [SAR202 cluster bacterium MP-SInd-SRR3963457-G1]PKB85671.1 MAG: addiction module toxin, HicA family [SAR202 cluster bacterium MP-NPac-SRR3961935-G1]RUA21242.1 MAG: addiction module toxin, HicA family [Chloroflexota bacterium]
MPKVRDAIRLVERDGWFLARTKGSHRQYKHPIKSGSGTWNSILKQAGLAREARE